MAALVQAQGDVRRSSGGAAWGPTYVGDQYYLGDGVRLRGSGVAQLRLRSGDALSMRPDTVVQFLPDGAGTDAFVVESGEAVLAVGEEEHRIHTGVGVAVLAAHSEMRISSAGEQQRYELTLGMAHVEQGGQRLQAELGDAIVIGTGRVLLERKRSAVAKATVETPPEAVAEPENAEEPTLAPTGEASVPHYDVRVGSAAMAARAVTTLHSPRLPVVVSVPVAEDACEGEAVMRIHNKRVRGEKSIQVPLGAGRHRYAMYCAGEGKKLGKRVGRGSIVVRADSADRLLPKKAPVTAVDIDGRPYLVLYQNQLPQVTVRWPEAPTAAEYRLSWVYRGRARNVSVSEPTYHFPSGALGDGEHVLTFSTAAGQQSERTMIEVQFDNAAPKVSVSSPRQFGFNVGETVSVQGVALPGWRVTLVNGKVALDEHQRFFGQVKTSAAQPHVVLRLSHPRRGVHYYLRYAAPQE